MKYIITIIIVISSTAFANETKMTIIDMGAGLCTVTKMSNDKFVVFDTGKGTHCKNRIKEIVEDNPIELLIISHADYDHFGGAKYILNEMKVKTILHTGFPRRQKIVSYTKLLKQISDGVKEGKFIEINLTRYEEYRKRFKFGDSSIQIMSGYGHNHYGFKDSKDSYVRNSVSIAAKIEYDGKSILITGDAKGKNPHENDSCLYAEKEMVDHNSLRPLKSDVLIAGHHGADDTTAKCFLNVVKPKYVVYSAGNMHGHPREANALRVLDSVDKENIFRTDRGSDEQSEYTDEEWKYATQEGCSDKKGDDDILVSLKLNNEIIVDYISQEDICHEQ